MRASWEVPKDRTVVVYCGSTTDCEQDAVISGKPTLCTLAIRYIGDKNKERKVRVLTGLIPEFAENGLLVSSSALDIKLAHLNSVL